MQNTIHYKTALVFSDGKEYVLKSTKNLDMAMEKAGLIRSFLEMGAITEQVDVEDRGDA